MGAALAGSSGTTKRTPGYARRGWSSESMAARYQHVTDTRAARWQAKSVT